ncbi:MAG: hypothetical protein ACTFAK_08975 [Candidatus Electronema sp. VV]
MPTRLAPGEVQVVLVLHPAAVTRQAYDFSDLTGRLAYRGACGMSGDLSR